MSSKLPDGVASFLARNIDSLDALEALLFLAARSTQELSHDAVARELRVDRDATRASLEALRERGLLTERDGRYQYAPTSRDLSRGTEEVARAYAERRVAVITAIFSKPSDRVQSFADAFRLKKD